MAVRVALDAMGGDYAPAETVRGAVEAAGPDLQVVLFGDRPRIEHELAALPVSSHLLIVHTTQSVDMHESPVDSYRKKPDSSLRRGLEAVRAGDVDVFVSAGNTGAVHAAALLTLRAARGVDRPAIGATLPTHGGRALLLDAGANVDCNARHLYQFAVMGATFVHAAWHVPEPTVGLLNIGEEPSKGNALAKQVYDRLQSSALRFIGNVEARELFSGKADVVVCDGFAGNVLLKAGEGVAEMIAEALLALSLEIGADVVKTVLHQLRRKMDYAVYGGAPLLGLNGACFIAHGRSKANAVASALRVAAECVESGAVVCIREQMKGLR